MPEKTVFLDRDGVVNCCPEPHEYIRFWDEFKFLPGAIEGVLLLNEAGYRVAVVSNQRGIALGLLTMAEADTLHQRMTAAMLAEGAHIDGVYICPHEVGICNCRKPETGLFLQAEADCPVDRRLSWMIGDSQSDIQAGRNYGIRTILIGAGDYGQDITCGCLRDAAVKIAGGQK